MAIYLPNTVVTGDEELLFVLKYFFLSETFQMLKYFFVSETFQKAFSEAHLAGNKFFTRRRDEV